MLHALSRVTKFIDVTKRKVSPMFHSRNIISKINRLHERPLRLGYDDSKQLSFRDLLTHFSPVAHFYTPKKRQKTFGFLSFSEGIEM